MAIRKIRFDDDPILRLKSKEVKEINESIKTLVEDMFETMYDSNGVGLAAPQIGVIRRVIVIDDYEGNKYALINPKIVSKKGEQDSREACLSLPGYCGIVKRPEEIVVNALDIEGKEIEIRASGMLTNILCHEIDHLDGILYKDRAYEYGEIDDMRDEEIE